MYFITVISVMLQIGLIEATFRCPSYSEEIKLKFDDIPSSFLYFENCPGGLPFQNALLGSQTVMDCGVDGALQQGLDRSIFMVEVIFPFTTFIKKLCLNVHGTDSVSFHMLGQAGSNHTYVQDLSDSSTRWTRFCVETGAEFQVFQWEIQLHPKYDGSKVMVKNMKLAACRFEFPIGDGGD